MSDFLRRVLAVCVAALLAVGSIASATHARCPRHEAASRPPPPGSFDCAAAPAALGEASAEVAFCQELLRDLWRVVLVHPERGGAVSTHRFVTESGVISETRGLGALEAYLRRTRVADAPWLDRLAFAELLEATHALPAGFTADALSSGVDPETGAPASVRTRPLVVSIVQTSPDEVTHRAVLTLSRAGKARWAVVEN